MAFTRCPDDPLRPDGVARQADQDADGAPWWYRTEHRGLPAIDCARRGEGQHLDALKKTYADGFTGYLAKHPTQYDPLKFIGAVQNDVTSMAQALFKTFGSAAQA